MSSHQSEVYGQVVPHVTAFKDKDTTFGLGVNIAGVNYEVHRFYPDEGIAWCCIALLVRSEG